MTEEKNMNREADQQQAEAHEAEKEKAAAAEAANGKDDEKKFSQKDLDRILGERLNRNKQNQVAAEDLDAKKAEIEEKESILLKRENRLSCREYLLEKNYPADLLDIINTDDIEDFKIRADKVNSLYHSKPLAQRKSNDPGGAYGVRGNGFGNTKHTPKNYQPHRFD